MIKKWLTAERYPSKVGTEFDNSASANAAILTLSRTPGLETTSIKLVAPGDPDLARKLEPESQGIARTLIRAHLTMGVCGLVLGLILALSLLAAGVPMITANPTTAIVTLAAFGSVFGLMAGGLVSLRPDHDPLIHTAGESSSRGKWFVVVHATDSSQRDHARLVLEELSKLDEPVLQTI